MMKNTYLTKISVLLQSGGEVLALAACFVPITHWNEKVQIFHPQIANNTIDDFWLGCIYYHALNKSYNFKNSNICDLML